MHDIAYVCVVSEFNLPTLQACLGTRPVHTVLIASDNFRPQAQLLQTLLTEKHPAGQTHVLSKDSTGQSLDGDDICANAQWLEVHLCPQLKGWAVQGLHVVVNITGGTKAMALALSSCHAWDWLDYQPIKKSLQSVLVSPHRDSGRSCFAEMMKSVNTQAQIGPLDLARLHNWQVWEGASNPLCEHPASAALAQSLWEAQRQNDEGLRVLFAGLERIWVIEPTRYQQADLALEWKDFIPAGETTSLEPVRRWVQRLSVLAPEFLRTNESSITLPSARKKSAGKYLRDWISGDWLEQLAGIWLIQGGVAPQAIARNLVGSPDTSQRSDSSREADLLIHHKNITTLVEIKAGIPPGKSLSEMENQLSSLGARFGKTDKALLLGPQFLQDLRHKRRIGALWFRCKANGVTLLLTKEHLIDFVQGKKPWKNSVLADGFPLELAEGVR